MSANIDNLTTQSFDDAVKASDKPLLVDFWAPWCGPCKAIAPILEDLASEMGDSASIAKVNIDDHSEISNRFNVRAIPTLLIFKGGEVVDQIVGMTGKEELKAKLQKHV